MQEFWLLPALLAVVWFWIDAMRAREAAVAVARRACREHDLQLLDETVVLIRLRFGRDSGRVVWRRRYQFEFSSAGDNRSRGEIELLGRRVAALNLDWDGHTLHDQAGGGLP